MTVTTPTPAVKPSVPTWVWVGVVTAMGGGFLAYYERKKTVPTAPTMGTVPPDKTIDEVPYSDGGYGSGGGGETPGPTQISTSGPPILAPTPPEPQVQPEPTPAGDPNYDGMGFYIGPRDTGGGPPRTPEVQPQMIDGWSLADHDAIITYLAQHPQTTVTTTAHGYR